MVKSKSSVLQRREDIMENRNMSQNKKVPNQLLVSCGNCEWLGMATLHRKGKLSTMAECPKCGCNWIVHPRYDPFLKGKDAEG